MFSNRFALLVGLLELLVAMQPASAGTMTYGVPAVQNLHEGAGRTGTKVDIVILAEGYTSAQMPRFASDARAVANAILGFEPYRTYSRFVRIWQVNTISTQSGIDHPGSGLFKDTCFDSRYVDAPGDTAGAGRLIVVGNRAQVQTAATGVPGADLVVVIANDPQYGGSGSPGVCATYNGASMNGIVTHEMGHAFANLGDEYFAANRTWTSGEPSWPNLTTQPSAAACKWSAWNNLNGVSIFRGGATAYAYGIFRPVNLACHMKATAYGLCPVCREAVIKRLYLLTMVSPARGRTGGATAGPATFFVDEIVPDDRTAVWFVVDGTWMYPTRSAVTGSVTRHTFETNLGTGTHTIRAVITDRTGWIRIGGYPARPRLITTWTVTTQ